MLHNIVDYGAKSGNGNLNTKAIQRAIDECAAQGGGTVIVPSGLFITGTIYLLSNVELHLEIGAELKASTNPKDYNCLNAYAENWSAPSEGWEGKHLIIAHNAENVAITGLGKINGAADVYFDGEVQDFEYPGFWSYGLQYQKEFRYGMKDCVNPRPGQTVVFINCRNIHITDITIVNSPAWCLFFHGCEDVQIRGYKAFNKKTWANTDGLDIDTCKNVTVSDCIIDTGDDAIAIRCSSKRLNNGMDSCENITITNCVLASSSSVFRLGVGRGRIRNVSISNIVIRRGGASFTLATHFGAACHCLLEDISIYNIVSENVAIPFELYAKEDCYIRNVMFVNLRMKCFKGATIAASESAKVYNVCVKDLNLSIMSPLFAQGILDENNRNSVFSIKSADHLKFENITVEIEEILKCKFDQIFSIVNSTRVDVSNSNSSIW